MCGMTQVAMGDGGRLAIPQVARHRHQLVVGRTLILLDSPDGLVLRTREQLKARVRGDFRRHPGSLVDELIDERRAEAERDLA